MMSFKYKFLKLHRDFSLHLENPNSMKEGDDVAISHSLSESKECSQMSKQIDFR